jgi:hypothetical protein
MLIQRGTFASASKKRWGENEFRVYAEWMKTPSLLRTSDRQIIGVKIHKMGIDIDLHM